MNKKKLVLIGNGMAGIRCIEEILKINPNAFEMTVIGQEPHPSYNRIMLSSVLQGGTPISDIVTHKREWYQENNIQLFTGEMVIDIDKERRLLTTDRHREVPYDKLILATGSSPFMLPLPGADKKGVMGFRTIEDCEKMVEIAKTNKNAVVIGGGLLGLEAARGLMNLKMNVTVVHLANHLMNKQLDLHAAELLKYELEQQGMNFLLEKQSKAIVGGECVTSLRFEDDTEIKTDLVVMAVGIKPNIQLAIDSDITINRGIVVNDSLQTSDPDIYAVGECAEHRGVAYGLVAPLYEQAKALAATLCNRTGKHYEGSIVSTQLKVSGVNVFSAGHFLDNEETQSIKIFNEHKNTYKKIVLHENHIVGAVLFGDTSEGQQLQKMVENREDISNSPDISILGTADPSTGNAITNMANTDTVCNCNSVTKGAICKAIVENDLQSVEEVKECTNASGSCGSCKPLVADLLQHTLESDIDDSTLKEPMCECTSFSHEEVIAEIKAKQLTFVREVMNVLDWKQTEGCSKCRPAINYYLGMLYPSKYEEQEASSFINERMYANVQADGTYSVVPRMYGGVTTSDELRKIADIADKYNVPMVKLTGGQRIDLLGIAKEDLPSVWTELGMPSGSAFGKSLRTVKTCVGKRFCRFGLHDATSIGILLEKKFEQLKMPHKVKMSASACARNCAESMIKDVGLVGVEGGWEIYVGGNGGTHLQAAKLLSKVDSEEDIIQMVGAFLQYYRENAHYHERTSQWIERTGLEHIREVLFDDMDREDLLTRLENALEHTKDPWKDIIHTPEKQEKFNNHIKVIP